MRLRNLAPLLALLLTNCAEERSAGNSIETENSVAARLLPIDSLLGASPSPTPRSVVATLRLGRANFPFDRSTRDGRDLRLETPRGEPIPFHIAFWDSAAALARLEVRLDSAVQASDRSLRLRWNVDQAKTLSDSIATWRGFSREQILAWTSVLVDDFEDGDDTSSVPGRTVWRNALTTNAGLTLSVTDAGRGRPGKALKATYSANYPSYVLVGVPLGKRMVVARSLDSLVFHVRGKGLFYVAFEHLEGSNGAKAWQRFYLDSGWTRKVVRTSELEFGNGVGQVYDWPRVRDSLTDITFFAQDGSEFQIDDIRLHGLVADDLR